MGHCHETLYPVKRNIRRNVTILVVHKLWVISISLHSIVRFVVDPLLFSADVFTKNNLIFYSSASLLVPVDGLYRQVWQR